nr:MAG TPA: hypothetical protein [Caudoviricetes sp.]
MLLSILHNSTQTRKYRACPCRSSGKSSRCVVNFEVKNG